MPKRVLLRVPDPAPEQPEGDDAIGAPPPSTSAPPAASERRFSQRALNKSAGVTLPELSKSATAVSNARNTCQRTLI